MNSPDPSARTADGAPANEGVVQEQTEGGLYQGDLGQLPLETRRVLVQLLAGPYLDGRRHTRLWPVLVRDETILRSRLHDLFLELVIDTDQQVAFTRQADAGDLETPILLRRTPLTFIDSVVLLFLRQRLTQADVRGERAVVDAAEILEHAAPFERAVSTDHAGFAKKIRASVEKMKKNSMLQKVRGDVERFEISPTLKLLFSAEQIVALTAQYQALAGDLDVHIAAEPQAEEDTEE
ncbi:DUF4194 domain-containing protein [Desulfatitalea alkaliphila]|uniref:DUF4194 domain-containing protein n=1 Tax=Desulfatitalea alkaliphila TaxID=2929485 RepID=A0AA41UJY6_9BACT|nr:DUF4194 domain-containing protein [Desulfatitalea alkaliphila]MCJ8499801.1 DUF4194 domain-containing protein [Desulfatitalea alkaliphila]